MMKIVYVIESLHSKGGAERILTDKMNYLVSHYDGYEVSVITCNQNPQTQPNAYVLSKDVKQIDLRIPYYSQYSFKYPNRLLVKWSLFRQLKKKLADTITEIDPDVLIVVGYFHADVVCSVKCRAKKIVESHEARQFLMSDKGLGRSFLSRLYMRLYRWKYCRNIEHKADVVVTLTQGDAKNWIKAKRVEVIPDFSVMPVDRLSPCKEKRVLAVGRLEWQKGHDLLLDVWKRVSEKFPEWRLDIIGSGTMRDSLLKKIENTGLQNVYISPFQSDISKEYANSSIFVLPSRYEGFSLVLLEAMMHGVPCVAFDCPFGPSDVVENNKSGFVVQLGNNQEFIEKICLFIEDEELRQKFSSAAVERAKMFDADKVMNLWVALFDSVCS